MRRPGQNTVEVATALFADGVARLQREGDLPVDADPTALALALLVALEGLTFLGRTGMAIDTPAATARSLADRLLPDAANR